MKREFWHFLESLLSETQIGATAEAGLGAMDDRDTGFFHDAPDAPDMGKLPFLGSDEDGLVDSIELGNDVRAISSI